MRSAGRGVLLALAAIGAGLLVPPAAGAHPLTGGPASPGSLALLAAGLAAALAGWIMISRGRGMRPALSRPGYTLLLVGVLLFLGGPEVAGVLSPPWSGPPPSTLARLEVLTPLDGQTVTSREVPVSLRLLEPAPGATGGRAAWRPVAELSAAGGHIHLAVDGRVYSMTWQPSLRVPVPEGTHEISVEYVASDHRPFSPRVVVTRRITVRPPAGPVQITAQIGAGRAALRWSDWTWDPAVVLGIALTVLGYLWVARRFPPRRGQWVWFWAGVLALAAALLSPLDAGADLLFTLHMAQHMLLLLVAPPLLALALPPALIGWLYRQPRLGALLHGLWSPIVSLVLFNGALLFWHLPFAYDATLRSGWVHAVEHVSFVAVGMIFWGVIVSPAPRLVRASFGLRLGLIVAADLVNFLLGFGLAFAGRPLYGHYTGVARLWGLSPLEDLHLGGALMWVMGQMMYAVPALILLNVLLRRDGADRGGGGPAWHGAGEDPRRTHRRARPAPHAP